MGVNDILPTTETRPVQEFETASLDDTPSKPSWKPSMSREKLFSKAFWVGDYNYMYLIYPNLPYIRNPYEGQPQPFFGVEQQLPLLLAALLGFQHALAMLAGIVTPPSIIAAAAHFDAATQSYLISASLIVCGFASIIQITRLRIGKTPYYIGTGLISVAGTSFGIVPIAQKYFAQQYARGYCATVDGIAQACPDAYGRLIGTAAVTACFHMALSFVPPRILKKLFPPMITGPVLLLIGASLIASGIKDWAGSSGLCSSSTNTVAFFKLCPNIGVPRPYAWGNARFIGLGFSVFVSIIIIERFGAPIMKTSGVVLGLLVGVIISAATGYWDGSTIKAAPAITFVWTKTFKLGFDATLLLPLLAVVIVLVLENIGDVTATCDVSKVAVVGREFESRIQGGVLADGVNTLISVLMTNTPLSTFAQNNGTIALTGVASRRAGYFCCFFLLLCGIIGKFGAVFVAIPPAVIGAMKTFLFASVAVSGLRLVSMTTWDRRNRFILTCAMSIALASLLVPNWFSNFFGYKGTNKGVLGLIDALVIVVETPYAISVFISVFLHLILPEIKEASVADEGILTVGTDKPSMTSEDYSKATSSKGGPISV